jgi:outer membrane protein TolC
VNRAAALAACALAGPVALAGAAALAQPPGVVAEPPPAISFDDAVARAMAQNPSARVAADEIVRVVGLLEQATAALAPQLDGNATYTRLEANRYVAGKLSADANSAVVQLLGSAPIVDLLLRADRDRAADQVAATAAAATSVRRDIAIATAHAYFTAVTAAQLVDIARTARDTARVHVDLATSRRISGLGADLDVVRAETEVATDDQQLASATNARIAAEEALGVITGTDGPLAAAGEPELELDGDPGDPRGRADVLASRAQAGAATHSRELGWTDWAPALRLTGKGFFTAPQVDPIPEWGYELDVSLVVPIYDGGTRAAVERQRRAIEAETHDQLAGVVRQARSDVRAAGASLDSARVGADAARRAAELAARALELAMLGYRGGTLTSLDIVDAERTSRDAAAQAAIAAANLREAELDVLAADGRFPKP